VLLTQKALVNPLAALLGELFM
jgi:hypothetical protein